MIWCIGVMAHLEQFISLLELTGSISTTIINRSVRIVSWVTVFIVIKSCFLV